MTENAGPPLAEGLERLPQFQVDEDAAGACCVVCGSPSTTQATDVRPTASPDSEIESLPVTLPVLQLCDDHWSAYRTDWLLIGWCVDHYAEALRYCEVHKQHVPPL